MKKTITGMVLAMSIAAFSGCATHNGLIHNSNQNSTVVELSSNNYKIIGPVSGSCKAVYVLGFGGVAKSALVNQARQAMYEQAKLTGSQAIIYENVNIKTAYMLLAVELSVKVDGYVVEFTK